MLGQKEAVIAEVMFRLPSFVKFQDNALLKLSASDLESVKDAIETGIRSGSIEYGKDINNANEVRTYARSMVMNHLKKAKELNGGHGYIRNTPSDGTTPRTVRVKEKIAPKGVDADLLPEELKAFAKTLV